MIKNKNLIHNKIDWLYSKPFVLNPYIDLVLTDAKNYKELNRLEEDDFFYVEDGNNNNDNFFEKLTNTNNNFRNKIDRPYCKKHLDWLLRKDLNKKKNNFDLFSMFNNEESSNIKQRDEPKLKRKLIEFCAWMNRAFDNNEESDFDPGSLIKIFIVNYENTMPVPIKIEEITDSRIKKELLKTNANLLDNNKKQKYCF